MPHQHSTTVLWGLNQTGKKKKRLGDKRRKDQGKIPITYTAAGDERAV